MLWGPTGCSTSNVVVSVWVGRRVCIYEPCVCACLGNGFSLLRRAVAFSGPGRLRRRMGEWSVAVFQLSGGGGSVEPLKTPGGGGGQEKGLHWQDHESVIVNCGAEGFWGGRQLSPFLGLARRLYPPLPPQPPGVENPNSPIPLPCPPPCASRRVGRPRSTQSRWVLWGTSMPPQQRTLGPSY